VTALVWVGGWAWLDTMKMVEFMAQLPPDLMRPEAQQHQAIKALEHKRPLPFPSRSRIMRACGDRSSFRYLRSALPPLPTTLLVCASPSAVMATEKANPLSMLATRSHTLPSPLAQETARTEREAPFAQGEGAEAQMIGSVSV
jgi:hypothetical protein